MKVRWTLFEFKEPQRAHRPSLVFSVPTALCVCGVGDRETYSAAILSSNLVSTSTRVADLLHKVK